jgi:hypothetical protein
MKLLFFFWWVGDRERKGIVLTRLTQEINIHWMKMIQSSLAHSAE